jgi:hypothetical protein
VESEIRYLRYVIGATDQGSRMLCRDPGKPLPLSDIIFLHDDDDVLAWLLANQQEDKNPLDLLVLEERQDDEEEPGQTPEPGGGRYPFFDRDVWYRGGPEELFRDEMGEDEDSDYEDWDGEGEDEDVEEGDAPAQSGARAVTVDEDENDVSLET